MLVSVSATERSSRLLGASQGLIVCADAGHHLTDGERAGVTGRFTDTDQRDFFFPDRGCTLG